MVRGLRPVRRNERKFAEEAAHTARQNMSPSTPRTSTREASEDATTRFAFWLSADDAIISMTRAASTFSLRSKQVFYLSTRTLLSTLVRKR